MSPLIYNIITDMRWTYFIIIPKILFWPFCSKFLSKHFLEICFIKIRRGKIFPLIKNFNCILCITKKHLKPEIGYITVGNGNFKKISTRHEFAFTKVLKMRVVYLWIESKCNIDKLMTLKCLKTMNSLEWGEVIYELLLITFFSYLKRNLTRALAHTFYCCSLLFD
jgi:hypothetical protein